MGLALDGGKMILPRLERFRLELRFGGWTLARRSLWLRSILVVVLILILVFIRIVHVDRNWVDDVVAELTFVRRQDRGPDVLARIEVPRGVGAGTLHGEFLPIEFQFDIVDLRAADRGRHDGVGNGFEPNAAIAKVLIPAIPDAGTDLLGE